MTQPQVQPQTDPPPVTTPPAETQPQPTAQSKSPVVIPPAQPDFSPLMDAIGALPEKLAHAVREQIPQSAPQPQAPATAGTEGVGGNTMPTKGQATGTSTQTVSQPAGRRSFGEWFLGAPKRGAQ